MHRIFSVCVLTMVMSFMPRSLGSANAQTCTNIPVPGNQSVQGFITHTGTSCTVTNGTYVVVGQDYKVDKHATADGSCIVRGYPNCSVLGTELRGVIGATRVIDTGTPNGPHAWTLYPTNNLDLDFDTRVESVKNPPGIALWRPLQVGTTTMKFRVNTNPTSCQMQPQQYYENPIQFHVLMCSPHFEPGEQATPERLPPGPTKISFDSGVPQAVRDALTQARIDWNAVQSAVTFELTALPCAGNDPHCIQVYQADTGTACSTTSPVLSDSSGYITEASSMAFPPDAAGHNADILRRLANHELGHLLGLGDYPLCAANNGLMGLIGSCNQASGFQKVPTPTDYIPVNQTSYGSNGTSSCPY